jgi:hypothetical protein
MPLCKLTLALSLLLCIFKNVSAGLAQGPAES